MYGNLASLFLRLAPLQRTTPPLVARECSTGAFHNRNSSRLAPSLPLLAAPLQLLNDYEVQLLRNALQAIDIMLGRIDQGEALPFIAKYKYSFPKTQVINMEQDPRVRGLAG